MYGKEGISVTINHEDLKAEEAPGIPLVQNLLAFNNNLKT